MEVYNPDDTTDILLKVDPQELVRREPFSTLFPIKSDIARAIETSMRDHEYDAGKPVCVWRAGNVVVDGHTRCQAAQKLGLDVWAVYYDFEDEDEAMAYAIANQRDRRNMDSADLLRCIKAADKLKKRGNHQGNQYTKKEQPKLEKVSAETFSNSKLDAAESIPSSAETAKLVGTSTATVARARAVLSDPELEKEVLTGKKTMRMAANEARARKREKKKPAPPKPAPAPIVIEPRPANNEPHPSRTGVMELSEEDAAWTRSFPMRAQVNSRLFDEDVIIYRDFHEMASELRRKILLRIGDRSPHLASHLFRRFVPMLDMPAPITWIVCKECEGKGCPKCKNHGYHLPKI